MYRTTDCVIRLQEVLAVDACPLKFVVRVAHSCANNLGQLEEKQFPQDNTNM